ncbi:MAG: metalloregulator ArsR/SmtB family transcription factor [Candidatus Bathyarchaeota archaeon]|nr:metalloregulator ArsR/SmtB family transcription factor [Candidatus Bathyarchaeota archaeon]
MEKAQSNIDVFEMQAEICKTLANSTRLRILHALREGEKSVGELTDLLGLRQSNLSQHLSIMRQAQILKTRKQGSNIYYSVAYPKINTACDLVRELLIESLGRRQELSKNLVAQLSQK